MTTPRQCRSGFTRLQDNRRRRRRKKIEEESETDGAEREESSEGMCRLEFKFIVKKKKTLLEIGLGTFQPDKVVQRGNGTRITEGVGFDW